MRIAVSSHLVIPYGKTGERAFEVGEPCTGLFLIVSGVVELRQASPRRGESLR
jgi:signal-transduction protein with cAMP-binding, CBS, and nucleotidyltransferase domain